MSNSQANQRPDGEGAADIDVLVVGAGMGGIYAVHRFTRQGLSTVCLETADGVGGVWRHNGYPGARVDLDSTDYTYYFSPEIYREWRWSERYASQPELLAYLEFVTDRLDLRRHMRFDAPLVEAVWDPAAARYRFKAGDGFTGTARFLVMTTGNLSQPRKPPFEGLESFEGEWLQTSRWPDRQIRFEGRRIAVIGTGSSGVQAIPILAREAEHLYVFQRTPHFSIPAQNRPLDAERFETVASDVLATREYLLTDTAAGVIAPLGPSKTFAEYTPQQRLERLEAQYRAGGQAMLFVFADQLVDRAVNDFITDFLKDKIRAIVKDPDLAETLCPRGYPIGTRRMALDIGYYETFNRDNVTLVDAAADPIERLTPTGIRTCGGRDYAVDLIIFAVGFVAFTGTLDQIDIRNAEGARPTDSWSRGPNTYMGLMTAGFPNLFLPTAPGSPSVNANMFLENEFHIDWAADCIAHMDREGLAAVEPDQAAIDRWNVHCVELTRNLLNRQFDNYKVKVNPDGSRVFWPYLGGLSRYVRQCREMTADNYAGFVFHCGDPSKSRDKPEAPSCPTR